VTDAPYDAVYADLDETLLTPERTVSPRTRRVLDALRARGVAIGVATGRTMRSARPHIDAAGADAPAILLNGARVQALDGTILHDVLLPSEAALRLIHLSRAHGVFMNLYHGDRIRIEERNETARASAYKDGVTQELVADLAAAVEATPPTKLMMIAPVDEMDAFARLAHEALAELGGTARVVRSEPTYLEAVATAVSKGDGLLHACRALGIPPSRVVAFGDGPNDLELLETAGLGVAMQNADPSVKAAADRVCPPNREDGVAVALADIFATGSAV
jgi:Cof subfamily protein (haloacid dehalogenase superfamily)